MHQLLARRLAGVAAACSLFALAACQSSTAGHGTPADQAGLPGRAAGATPSTGDSSSGSNGTGSNGGDSGSPRQVNKSVYFGGFKVEVQTASLQKDENSGGPVAHLDIIFANQGDQSARFESGDADLSSKGNHYQASFSTEDTPTVPGKSAGHGELNFDVDGNFSFDDAMLTFGKSDKVQATLPLGGSGELVAHEPQQLKLTGSTTSDQIRVTLNSGELRPDIPRRHDESRAGHTMLKIVASVTVLHINLGGYPLGPSNFALTLPDGTRVATVDNENMIRLVEDKATAQDVEMWFDIPAPAKGRYLFMLTDNFRAGGKPPLTTAVALNLNGS
jgi:hypothetical protein